MIHEKFSLIRELVAELEKLTDKIKGAEGGLTILRQRPGLSYPGAAEELDDQIGHMRNYANTLCTRIISATSAIARRDT